MEIDIPEFRVSMHWNYFQVCRDHIKKYEATEQEIEKYRASDQETHIIEMNVAAAYSRRERSVVIPIVFSAMCLEAFIYDYGATKLSGSFVKNHIDKLEVPSKYVVLTKLVTGKQFDTNGQAYEKLKTLIKDRNQLVHFKSKGFSFEELEKVQHWHEEMNTKLKAAMYNAYDAVIEVMKEMDRLHENSTNYYLTYITEAECHA
ncbi:hypothetical protein A3197_18070 [Candidatus Thiodiazotropha endoloripes]|nr:hypothetical protein A3197_18070 [Candidatus Thiodiazotropha endoloripes]